MPIFEMTFTTPLVTALVKFLHRGLVVDVLQQPLAIMSSSVSKAR
jgi:hypothetical protein